MQSRAYDKKSMNIWVKIAREQARETKTETETRKMLGNGSERGKGKAEGKAVDGRAAAAS